MSAIYNLEPAPTASAVISTTQGDLSIELFAKQTPLTCRNFLQLALDGYYDNTVFHRLIPGFILQGGDPTGTGNGGESIYDGGAFGDELDPWPMDQRHGANAGSKGVGFRDEFHSRLKFNRRGLLGMANESKPDTNGSQFFFTLDKTEELTSKNTLFGRIVGDTIYNLAKMGEAELEAGSERPTYPVKITGIEILVNPFDDMKKRERLAPQTGGKISIPERKKKRKGGKQLLSFGDDEGDGDMVTPLPKKAKFDSRIAMDLDEEPVKKKEPKSKKPKPQPEVQERRPSPPSDIPEKAPPASKTEPSSKAPPAPIKIEDSSPEPDVPTRRSALDKTNAEIAALKASMRRNIETPPVESTKKVSALESMIPETSIRGRKRRPGGPNPSTNPTKEDLSALNLLKAFQTRLDHARPEKEQAPRAVPAAEDAKAATAVEKTPAAAPDEEAALCDLHFIAGCESCQAWDERKDEESDDDGWMGAALSFKADKLGKDLSFRKQADDDLVVIDPLSKGRSIQEKRKAEREARSGNTGREWDQARNAKMARASALAGRGAK